jgi:hypothetical protein
MISTPGFSSLALEIWSMEVEHPDCQPWDDEDYSSVAAFRDRVCIFTSQSDDKQRLQQFLAPMNGDMKSLVSTTLKQPFIGPILIWTASYGTPIS